MKKVLAASIIIVLIISACSKNNNNNNSTSNNNNNNTSAPTACFTAKHNKIGLQVYDTFTSCSQNAASYQWVFGDGDTSTLQNPTHIFNNVGTYYVKLTTFNGNMSQKAIDSMPIVVDTAYNVPYACAQVDPSSQTTTGDTTFCNAYCSEYYTSASWQDVTVSGPVYNGVKAKIVMTTTGTHTIVLTLKNNVATVTKNYSVVVQ